MLTAITFANKPLNKKSVWGWFIISLLFFSTSSSADALQNAQKIERQTNQLAQQSQQKVNANSDATFRLQAEVEQLQAQIDNLSLYQQHMEQLIASQQQEMASKAEQLDGIAHTRQGVVPLMYHMLDGLHNLIEQDIPVRLASREQRLQDLKQMMTRADVAEAEKYRRILEAYQIEIDYGAKMGLYNGQIQLTDNDQRQVEVLYIGRVLLVARSSDNRSHWLWLQAQQQWQPLSSEQGIEVNKAFAMANKQQAPSLISLPLSISQVDAEAN